MKVICFIHYLTKALCSDGYNDSMLKVKSIDKFTDEMGLNEQSNPEFPKTKKALLDSKTSPKTKNITQIGRLLGEHVKLGNGEIFYLPPLRPEVVDISRPILSRTSSQTSTSSSKINYSTKKNQSMKKLLNGLRSNILGVEAMGFNQKHVFWIDDPEKNDNMIHFGFKIVIDAGTSQGNGDNIIVSREDELIKSIERFKDKVIKSIDSLNSNNIFKNYKISNLCINAEFVNSSYCGFFDFCGYKKLCDINYQEKRNMLYKKLNTDLLNSNTDISGHNKSMNLKNSDQIKCEKNGPTSRVFTNFSNKDEERKKINRFFEEIIKKSLKKLNDQGIINEDKRNQQGAITENEIVENSNIQSVEVNGGPKEAEKNEVLLKESTENPILETIINQNSDKLTLQPVDQVENYNNEYNSEKGADGNHSVQELIEVHEEFITNAANLPNKNKK